MTNRELIEHEFETFFDFETEERKVVSVSSCKFFAEHIMKLERERLSKVADPFIIEACGKTLEELL